jgi:3-dehydroquinate dehydratase-2
MGTILLLNGPNLNLLGEREPEVYGRQGLGEIVADLTARAAAAGHRLEHLQSNSELDLIGAVHAARGRGVDLALINPGAFTHTSVALRDAFSATRLPFIEVHLSNVHAREAFRRHSLLAPVAIGVIAGFGAHSYVLALEAALQRLGQRAPLSVAPA